MTTLRDDLDAAGLAALPLDHDWSLPIGNGFLAANAESRPELARALALLSEPALFALAVAASEWVVARVAGHTDVDDARLRLDAAWAATLDPARAHLPKPGKTPEDADLRAARPMRLAMVLLGNLHEGLPADDTFLLFGCTLRLVMVAEHVTGRVPAFNPWLEAVLKSAASRHPASPGTPYRQQPPVAPSFFRLPGGTVSAEQTALLSTQNPYLRQAKAFRVASGTRAG